MAYNKEHILVFLAYISDVEPEVNEAKDIVERINRAFESSGIQLDLRTWKDVPEEFGNPQEKINRTFVDKCDIFIGLIWKKWGTPTGRSDCGFREEFDIAENRYKETGMPIILLYAKTVNETDVKDDEKEGLQKNKEFRQEIINNHKGFLIEFKTSDEWKEIIRERLTQYVVSRLVTTEKATTESQSLHTVSSEGSYEVIEKIRTPKEIQVLINDLAMHKSNIEKINNLDNFKKIRLYLFSSAIFYDAALYEILGNHEIHLLYLQKENIKPIGLETKLIFRTIIGDKYSLKTGWFWLKHIEGKILRDYVSSHLINDANKEVRYGALIFIDTFWLKRYKHQLINAIADNEDEIKLKALEICAVHGDENYLETINGYLVSANKDVIKAAWTAKFAILSRTNHNSAVDFLQEFNKNRGSYNPYLERIASAITDLKLKELITDKDLNIKVVAYKQLVKRGLLNIEELYALINSEIIELRVIAYLALIQQGEQFNARTVKENWSSEQGTILTGLLFDSSAKQMEVVINKIFDSYQKDTLMEEINWLSSTTGPLAYFSFGCRFFDSFQEQLYQDLDTNFKRIKDKCIETIKQDLRKITKEHLLKDPKLSNEQYSKIESTAEKMIEHQVNKNVAEIDKLDNYISTQFILSALKILVCKGTSDSLKFARKYADSNDKNVQGLVVQLITKYGDSNDISALVKIAFDNYGAIRIEAVKQSLQLSDFDMSLIRQYVESGKEDIIKTSLTCVLTAKDDKMIGIAKELLMHKSDDIRIYALSYLAHLLTNKNLSGLLSNYVCGTTYYYNVVCWLDRIMFAPPKIRSFYKKELLNKLKENN